MAAYDRSLAWRAFGLIVLGLALAVAVVWIAPSVDTGTGPDERGAGAAGGRIGVYFLLSYDWTAGAAKFAVLQGIGLWVQANRPAIALPEDINANVAASGLICTLFLGLGGLLWAIKERLGLLLLLAVPAWLAGLATLILTTSRGAWLGVGAGLLAMGYLLLRRRLDRQRIPRLVLDLLAIAAILSVVAAFWIVVRSPGAAQVLGTVPAGGSAFSRATLCSAMGWTWSAITRSPAAGCAAR